MAHEVHAKIHTAVVVNKDLEIVIKTDNEKVGTLLISKGNVEWLPKGNYINKRRLSWKKFAAFMEEYGRPVRAK